MPTVSRGTYSWLFHGVAVLEDFADRLSHVWTFGLLLIFAAIVSWKQETQDPIRCATPNQFTSAMNDYAHAACWASHSAYIPMAMDFPVRGVERFLIVKYKWLPVILVIQALLFKFPNILMHVLHGYSGISFEKIAGFTKGFSNLNLAERSQLGQQIGHYLYFWCKQVASSCPWRGVTLVWLLVKILFCSNAVTQLVLTDRFLTTRFPPFDNSTSYGDVIYQNLFNSTAVTWKQSPAFPRIILCEYDLRTITNVHSYTIQCVLPVSEFTEYVYMLIWIWLLIVCVVSCFSFVSWLILTLIPLQRQRYISKMLNLCGEESQLMRNNADKLTDLVGEDGVSVLKLLSSNSSELLVRDTVWSIFTMSQRQNAAPYSYAPVMTQAPPTAPPNMASATPLTEMTGAHAPGKVSHVS